MKIIVTLILLSWSLLGLSQYTSTQYWVPNTFTPNGDEYNATWGPVFTGPYDEEDFNLIVFNRWGNLVWESHDANAKWDGSYNGSLVSDGVYTWVIDFGIHNTDERRLLHGHVTIIR